MKTNRPAVRIGHERNSDSPASSGGTRDKEMTLNDLRHLLHIEDVNDLPGAIMSLIERGGRQRDDIYRQLLGLNKYDVSYDWFSDLYESELAQRKQNKQDFTPNSVSQLASLLTGNPKGITHEPTAGNGSMIIADWWNRYSTVFPWQFKPSENMYSCWKLSARSIPLLLLNLSIRGIAGEVYHGDVLEQTVNARYVLINEYDNCLAFSQIVRDDPPKDNKR